MRKLFFAACCLLIQACQSGPKENVMATYGNGNPMNVVITDPETGEKIGEKTFYDNKQVHTDVLIKENKRNGTCRSFYKDGKPFSLHTYELGVKNGPYQLWYENGQIRIDGFYKDNKPSGVWKTYQQDGKLIKNENMDSKESSIIVP
jgi:antitoxin component YwqK of YwqJK toxin-antitoxin module